MTQMLHPQKAKVENLPTNSLRQSFQPRLIYNVNKTLKVQQIKNIIKQLSYSP